MAKKKVKTYTAEFKESAVKLAVESDQPVTDTTRDPGVNANTLHTWISKYHRPKAPGKAENQDEHLYDELKRLRKENARLKEEHAILKNGSRLFCKRKCLRFQFIRDHQESFSIVPGYVGMTGFPVLSRNDLKKIWH